MHARFGLTLVVNHACNLRCTYCYTGEKLRRPMPRKVGRKAIDRAMRSVAPGGTLELAFFGGEPLIEADLILELIEYARTLAAPRDVSLQTNMTTNGTLDAPSAWRVMTLPDMQLAISHDGLPEIHDRHRITVEGHASSTRVREIMERLRGAEKEFRVVTVLRPDTVELWPAGMEYLNSVGVRRFDPSLDLWTTWTRADGERLKAAIRNGADFWVEHLPECSVSWFDEKAAKLARVPMNETARCSFGHAEIAVTPVGNLYPCERLVGADEPGNAMRLPGDVFDGEDFLSNRPAAEKSAAECSQCALRALCSTTCRCSNYVRTGDVTRPDGLLCLWDQTCHSETIRVLESRRFLSTSSLLSV